MRATVSSYVTVEPVSATASMSARAMRSSACAGAAATSAPASRSAAVPLTMPPRPRRGGLRCGLDPVERAELALGRLRSAEPRLGQPWPPLHRPSEDLAALAQHGRSDLL